MAEKSTAIAMIISFIFTGLGIAYLGDIKKGVGFFAIGIILSILGLYVSNIFNYIAILFWIVVLYLTYQEAQAINGE
ncbi:hypothetical protein [Methanobrevibacter olleyae]|uniref:TM2 domain-containing protein n=1 Tax=Methanobrevibacter olleyae TaxID=294671 RepID=A0A126R018_METOL|nr:hypothetical protein [Methanobrevibacter olleyae]AMK15723.1 hypothetical protein YLM1_1166 [Methanobrevibacter olleyae]SFL77370.1 hypothetical protein SAMN02910297_01720 [Methanobrevibacter olleyae]